MPMNKIGFFPGTFDLVHAGHVIAFEECKKYCDFLIIGLQVDPSLDRPEKNKPIMSVEERFTILRGSKWVDSIILYQTEEDLILLDSWLPVDYRFRGIEYKGKYHYPTKGEFVDIVGDNRYHSSELRGRVHKSIVETLKKCYD